MDEKYYVMNNIDVQLLIHKYDLTYPQARRYQMRVVERMQWADVAKAEGVAIGAIQNSVQQAKMQINRYEEKMNDPGVREPKELPEGTSHEKGR